MTLRRETPKQRIPLSLAYTLSYGHTEATPESFCASFNACTPDVVALLRQNRGARHAHGDGHRSAGQQSARSVARLAVVARGDLELAATSARARSSSSPGTVADYSWYRPIARDVVFSWRVRGGAIFAPTVDVATQTGNFIPPDQRFYAGGPNDVRGFERNELGPVVYVVPKGEVDTRRGQGRDIDPDSVTVAATGGNTLAVGNVELRVPSPVFSSRLRLAAFVDAGGVWHRGSGNSGRSIRVTPGRRAPARHAARARAARRGLQSVQAAGGHRSSSSTPWATLTPVPGQLVRAGPERQVHLPLRGGAGVLMRRRLARFFFVFLLGTVAMVLGVVTSMTLTPPGRRPARAHRLPLARPDRDRPGEGGRDLGLVPLRPDARGPGGARHQRRAAGRPAAGAGDLPAAEPARRRRWC